MSELVERTVVSLFSTFAGQLRKRRFVLRLAPVAPFTPHFPDEALNSGVLMAIQI